MESKELLCALGSFEISRRGNVFIIELAINTSYVCSLIYFITFLPGSPSFIHLSILVTHLFISQLIHPIIYPPPPIYSPPPPIYPPLFIHLSISFPHQNKPSESKTGEFELDDGGNYVGWYHYHDYESCYK